MASPPSRCLPVPPPPFVPLPPKPGRSCSRSCGHASAPSNSARVKCQGSMPRALALQRPRRRWKGRVRLFPSQPVHPGLPSPAVPCSRSHGSSGMPTSTVCCQPMDWPRQPCTRSSPQPTRTGLRPSFSRFSSPAEGSRLRRGGQGRPRSCSGVPGPHSQPNTAACIPPALRPSGSTAGPFSSSRRRARWTGSGRSRRGCARVRRSSSSAPSARSD